MPKKYQAGNLSYLKHDYFSVPYIKWNEMKLILKSGKPKRLMELKVLWQFMLANSLKWQSAVAFVRKRLTSTSWSNWKNDLRHLGMTFSNNDGNLSLIYRWHSITKCASFSSALQDQKWHSLVSLEIGMVVHRPLLMTSLWFGVQ